MRYNTLSEVPLEAGAVEAWLKEQPEMSRVGYTRDGDECPLACYLNAHLVTDAGDEQGKATVGEEFYGQDGEEAWELPDWAKDFVRVIDELDGAGLVPVKVTATDALRALHAVVAAQQKGTQE